MIARPAVVLRDVKKSFPLGDGKILEVLDVEHLALPAGTATVLRGRSGSGKTTLLNLVAGVSVPTAGTIHVDDTDIFTLPEARRDRFRAEQIGYVFQTFNLLAAFSALENVMLAMMFARAVPRRLHRARARAILERLGLGARLGHKPGQLSRGEQQRVAIARALANDPPLILADEPCAGRRDRARGARGPPRRLPGGRQDPARGLARRGGPRRGRPAPRHGAGQRTPGGRRVTPVTVVWRYLQGRFVTSALTVVSVGLGVSLVIASVLLARGIKEGFIAGATDYNLIVGAKG